MISGCNISDRKNFYFEDTNNTISNDKICFAYCMERQDTNDNRSVLYAFQYHCDYEIECNDGECICKTR